MHDLSQACVAAAKRSDALHCATQLLRTGWLRAGGLRSVDMGVARNRRYLRSWKASAPLSEVVAQWNAIGAIPLRRDELSSRGDDRICSHVLFRFIRLDGSDLPHGGFSYRSVRRNAGSDSRN